MKSYWTVSKFCSRRAIVKTSRRLLSLAWLSAFALVAAPSANGQPTISAIEDQVTSLGLPTELINFTVTDPETPSSGITVTAASSNPARVPDGNIVLGGSGENRTISLLPAGLQRGEATITLTATDGSGQKGTRSFVLTVAIIDPLLNNTQRIDIRDAAVSSPGTSVPYPSIISLQGIVASVGRVTVTLNGFTHGFPDDVDVLLVSPDNSQKVMLMSGAGRRGP